ncbi:MAG: radical SAM protein [Planctomycetota bacterium]|jgi:MoaA/NifB/PqqE/SkfB family radical SAM enzyme
MRRELTRGLGFLKGMLSGAFLHCEVFLTYECNLRCDFCSFWRRAGGPEEPLLPDDYRRMSGQLAGGGALIISLEGGEPFLRDDLEEIVAAFARHHYPMVYTNGTPVTAARARRLFEAGLWQAAVSIDYADPAGHDRRRGATGTHARALEALATLRDAAPRGGRQVHAYTVLMDDNVDGLGELLERTERLGVGHQVSLVSDRSPGNGEGVSELPPAGVGRKLMEFRRVYRHLDTFKSYLNGVDRWLAGAPVPRCRAGRRGFTVDPAGNVSLCNERMDAAAGSLTAEDWPAVRERLRALSEKQRCNRCFTLCRGVSGALAGDLGPLGLLRALGDFSWR